MATYCGHSNAPAEYAMKERRKKITATAVVNYYTSHVFDQDCH